MKTERKNLINIATQPLLGIVRLVYVIISTILIRVVFTLVFLTTSCIIRPISYFSKKIKILLGKKSTTEKTEIETNTLTECSNENALEEQELNNSLNITNRENINTNYNTTLDTDNTNVNNNTVSLYTKTPSTTIVPENITNIENTTPKTIIDSKSTTSDDDIVTPTITAAPKVVTAPKVITAPKIVTAPKVIEPKIIKSSAKSKVIIKNINKTSQNCLDRIQNKKGGIRQQYEDQEINIIAKWLNEKYKESCVYVIHLSPFVRSTLQYSSTEDLMSVFFPEEDYEQIVQKLKNHNKLILAMPTNNGTLTECKKNGEIKYSNSNRAKGSHWYLTLLKITPTQEDNNIYQITLSTVDIDNSDKNFDQYEQQRFKEIVYQLLQNINKDIVIDNKILQHKTEQTTLSNNNTCGGFAIYFAEQVMQTNELLSNNEAVPEDQIRNAHAEIVKLSTKTELVPC